MSNLDKSFDDWLKEQNQPASNFLRREAYEAGQQSRQKEIDRLKAIITEALAVYDRPMCDETALYQRDDDIYHILTEDKFV
jgi:hypothetical protein